MNSQYQPAQGHSAMGQTYYQPPNVGNGNSPPSVGYAHSPPVAPTSSGVKRSTCLALLAAVVILLAAVVGLSAGLGVSQRNLHNTQADLAKAIKSPSATTTVAPASTGSPTSSSASASATADTSNITCPGSNNTLYTADTDSKRFRQYCGIDYSGDEAQAVGSVKVTSMDACMDACAAQSNCTGAGWGYLNGDNGAEHTCWMKTNLTTSHQATSTWAFAILLTGSSSSSEKRGDFWRLSWRA
ncbi:hypothetical protein VM1G_07608 [Cytospora mali]|uniref:Apple domain-containing protein n=1 Tax=Cytospora mali TaxID=578113 RepID=A0A194W6W9_CYTMA|nr:hypothetical protein VM1G_07608 [Valsa mali]